MDPVRRVRRGAVLTAVLANVTAAGAYTGAVTGAAFLKFVLPAVLLAGAATLVGTRKQFGGLIASLIVAGAWATVVNSLSGETSGPVARSAAVCGLATAISVFAARRSWAPVTVLGMAINLGGALFYGAAGEVEVLALIAGLLVLVSVGLIDAARHQRTVQRPRLAAIVFGLLAAATLVLGAVAVQQLADQWMKSEPPIASSLVSPEAVQPPWGEPPADQVTSTTTADPIRPPAVSAEQQRRIINLVALLIVLLLVLVVLAVLIRLALGAWRLRRWKRRLTDQAPADSAGAAFGWMAYHLHRLGWRAPGNPGLDRLAVVARDAGWPEPLLEPVRSVCNRSQRAVFEGIPCDGHAADDVWKTAEEAVRCARTQASRLRRIAAIAGLLRT